jgi:hypothetical protein
MTVRQLSLRQLSLRQLSLLQLSLLQLPRLERLPGQRRAFRGLLLAIGILALCACGGGGGAGSLASAPGGIDRSGQSVGTVGQFGSVFVCGVEYRTTGATIIVDGQAGQEADLRVGQVVTVFGTRDASGLTGTATRIVYDDNVEGPISVLDPTNGRLVVLGQTVLVDASTVFDDGNAPRDLTGLALGDVVEVSGFVDAAGNVRASRIERKAAGGELEVRGTVSAVDTGARQFTINGLRVDYATATLADFDGANPANGQLVEVKGTTFGTGGVLVATRVERETASLIGTDGRPSELEGYITRFASAQDFDVSGVRVTTSASTTFAEGSAADLAVGVKVEVDGTVSGTSLAATAVRVERDSSRRVAGRVQAVDAAAGRLTVLGVVVSVDINTQFEDNTNQRLRPFNLGRINVDDFVEVRGAAGTGAVDIVASRVERDELEAESEVRGMVETFLDPTIVIGGVTVTVGDGTDFKDRDGNEVSRAAFFTALRTGDRLKASGQATGPSAIAGLEVEYED